ncbi:MAG: pilin assembly protein [Pseudomonadales bacterium]
MKVQDLLCLWEKTANGKLTREEYNIRLPIEDAAKLQALAEMYPRRSIANIITDLLSAALTDVETSLPYVRGNNIVARDEEGDPLYEDIGPTPRYLSLTQKHMSGFQQATKDTH